MRSGRAVLPIDWLILVGALVTVAALWLANVEGFTFGNDPNYNLGTGFTIRADDAFLAHLETAAIANCPPDDTRWCPKYQQLIHSNLFFNYPLFAAFGRFVAIRADQPFAAAASRAAMGAVATGFALAACLFLVASAALTPLLRCALGLLLIVGAIASTFGRPMSTRQLDIVTSITWPRLAVIAAGLALLALFALVGRLPPLRRLGSALSQALSTIPSHRLAIGGGTLIVALLAARVLPIPPTLVLLLGIAGFACVLAALCLLAEIGIATALALALTLYLLVGPSYFFTLVPHTAPRGNIFLFAAPYLAYLLLRPNGKLVLLLPVIAVFHISVAGLIAAALFLVELVVCIIQRRVTLLLAVAAFVAVAARLYSAALFNAFGAGLDGATILATVLASDRALPGLLSAGSLGIAGLALAARREAAWQAAGRAVLLTSLLAGIGQIPPILDLAGYTFFDPGLTIIMLAPAYLAPVLTIGVPLVILAAIAGGAEPQLGGGKAAILALTGLAMLAIVRVEGRGLSPGDWARTFGRGAEQLAAFRGDPDPRRDPLFARLRADDERYLLRSELDPMNDPVLYLSLLKYKVRAAAGLFDPGRAAIETIDGTLSENRPERAIP